jgi:hypothetical protein
MGDPDDLQARVSERIGRAVGEATVTFTPRGIEIVPPDGDVDMKAYLALYGRLFAATFDVIDMLSAEVERLKAQLP